MTYDGSATAEASVIDRETLRAVPTSIDDEWNDLSLCNSRTRSLTVAARIGHSIGRRLVRLDNNILHAIGNTSLVELCRVVPAHCARIFARVEWENPTGSMKDRVAQAMISRAEANGRLKPGDTIVEYTGGSTGTVLKRYKPTLRVVVVEPAESAVLSGGQPGPHKIEGVGIGCTPPLWEPSLVDGIIAIKTADAKEMARRLAREEGLFAGTSSGANVLAAIQVGRQLGPGGHVVTLMVDSGLKYLSTDVYRKSV